jgi:hypothetical protein
MLLVLRRRSPSALSGLNRTVATSVVAAVVGGGAGAAIAAALPSAGAAGSVLAATLAGVVAAGVFVAVARLWDRPTLDLVLRHLVLRRSARAG